MIADLMKPALGCRRVQVEHDAIIDSVAGVVMERPTRVRWVIFTLSCVTSWLLYLHRYSWGVIKPAFREEHPEYSDTDIGWLDSAFNATYAVGQVPGG